MSPPTDESRRTAFAAAYLMGTEGRELFTWLAGEDLPEARRAAVLSLYLRWHRDRAFVFDLLDDLAGRTGLPPILRRGRVLRFLGDLSITIYTNNPHDPEVIDRTSRLWHRVLRRRLRLDRLLFLVRAPILGHIQAIVSARTLRMAAVADVQDPALFFKQGPEDRARFLRVVPLIDPGAAEQLPERLHDLAAMLESPLLVHRVLAALVIAIHAVRDPEATREVMARLHDIVGGTGRMWTTLAYSVPLPDTPDAWVAQLESMTRELVDEHRPTFGGLDDPLLAQFDIVLLPLGLAYGKRGGEMSLFAELLARGLAEDRPLAVRTVRGLAAVGVYYPHAVFELLRSCLDELADPDLAAAFIETLAAMRALHFDLVDLFLQQSRVPDAVRDRVSRLESPRLVDRCVQWLGYYGNAVHASLNYPIMRRALVGNALLALGSAHSAADFLRAYTPTLLDLLEETDFEPIRWTERHAAG